MSMPSHSRRTHLRLLGHAAGAGVTAFAAGPTLGAQYAVPQTADAVPRMSMDDFKRRVDAGTVVVVDVRSRADHRLGHIPGARSIPLNEVAARVQELRGVSAPIVTYCT